MRIFSNLEAFLLRKRSFNFEAWQAALVALFVLLGLVAYGAMVKGAAENYGRSGVLSKAAFKVASIPSVTAQVFSVLSEDYHPEYAWEQRFDDQSGFSFSADAASEDDLLLLSRYDGDTNRTSVELVDLATGNVIHRYAPNTAEIAQDLRAQASTLDNPDPRVNLTDELLPHIFGIYHPLIEPDGSLVFQNFYAPMIKIDRCSKLDWTLHGAYHHAIETDSEGNYWTVKRQWPASLQRVGDRFEDDTLVSISPDGETLFEKPLSQILLDNGYDHLVYPHLPYFSDPFHLNDVQPVLTDGPHWKKGDLFLSVRDLSRIIHYRPSTNEILWMKNGPWMLQHDVDVINDHQISIFNNNVGSGRFQYADHVNDSVIFGPQRDMYVLGTNETLVYDFETDQVSSPYKNGYESHDIRTVIEGLNEVLPNGDVFIEESKYGRLLVMSKSGDIRWSYVNRAENGTVYILHWSRYINGELAQALRNTFAETAACED